MNVWIRISRVFAACVMVCFSFYLFLTLVILPAALPWAISTQGSRLLKTPVRVRAVFLNPFLWRLNVKGLQIQDADKNTMIGFERFWADLSFLSLFKKHYRVESLGLEGLQVNAVLSEQGSVNLLDLVPGELLAPAIAGQQGDKPAGGQEPAAQAKQALPLPLVTVESASLNNSVLRFSDRSLTPNFNTSISGINLQVKNLSTDPAAVARLSFKAKLDDKGMISSELSIRPFSVPLMLETAFSLDDYVMQVLTPYTGKYAGRTVKSGKLVFSMDYIIADNKLDAKHKLLVQGFDFGDKVASKDALNLPFGLALALLEDSQNRISIVLPVTGDMSKPEFHYFHLIGQVLRNFFFKLVTKPFTFLGSLVSAEEASEELGFIKFSPGKIELPDSEKEKLNLVVKALNERPKLYLKVNGAYDPVSDWRSIKEDVFNKDMRELKGESKRLEGWVYKQLYERRFGKIELWKLVNSYRGQGKDQDSLNTEIKRRLIEEGSPNKLALEALAEARAKMVYDFIICGGFEGARVGIGDIRRTKAVDGMVALELGLTVFGDEALAPILPAEEKQEPAG